MQEQDCVKVKIVFGTRKSIFLEHFAVQPNVHKLRGIYNLSSSAKNQAQHGIRSTVLFASSCFG